MKFYATQIIVVLLVVIGASAYFLHQALKECRKLVKRLLGH